MRGFFYFNSLSSVSGATSIGVSFLLKIRAVRFPFNFTEYHTAQRKYEKMLAESDIEIDPSKDFNFDSILSFWKDGISFKPGQEKQNQKWTYININGINFYNSKNSDGSVPKDWYVYYMSKNLLYLSEIKDWKFFWDWLQINRDKDITRIKQVY